MSIKVIGIIIPTAITTPGIEYPIEKTWENFVSNMDELLKSSNRCRTTLFLK